MEGRLKALFTMVSLLLGWWGIPFGPIFTVRAVVKNLSGGQVVTVAELLRQSRCGPAPSRSEGMT
jgi:hypothetical protein